MNTSTIDLAAADAELSRTKIALMSRPDSAFFTTLCFSMRHKWDDNIPTACTDGRFVYWSPSFFMERLVDREERLFVMVHECMHPAYLHMIRRPPGACPDLWNVACDHVINLQLIERGFKMPTKVKGHADPRFKGMSAEEVYKILAAEASQEKPMMVDLMEPSGDPADQETLIGDLQDILVRARIQSKLAGDKPGTIPGDIEIMLDKLLDPKLPVKVLLKRWMQAHDKTNYNWKKPNRRFFPKDHLPSLWGESLIDLAWAVDSSGSVSDHDFLTFISEIRGVFRMCKPKRMTLLDFDTRIHHVHDVTTVQQLERVKFSGRGGTDVTPVFHWANEHRPQALIIFTDGGFSFPKVETKVPILWFIHNNPKWTAPYGKVIHYEIK